MMGRQDLVALDLGCGTGFAAEAFADMVAAIDGIDLSPAMIEKRRCAGSTGTSRWPISRQR